MLRSWSERAALVLTVAVTLWSTPLAATGAVPVDQLEDSLVVQLTNPEPGQQLLGSVQVRGVAADRRSGAGSGLRDRDVRLFLNDPTD